MKKLCFLILLPFYIQSQNTVGVNQNFNAFVEYTQQSFSKDTVVLYRPYELPIRIPIIKDNFGYKATYKGFFEYKEELLRKDGYFTGRVYLKVFTDYRFRLEIEHSISKTAEKPYFMIPGVLYGAANNQNDKTINLNYGKTINKYNTADIQTRADRATHSGVICIKNNQVLLVGCQETALGKDTLYRISELEPLYPYNGIFIYTSPPKQDKIGFSIGYKHIPFRYKGLQSVLEKESFDTSHTEGWIEKKMGKVLSFKTLYYISNATHGIRSYDKALRCYYKEFHEEPQAKTTRTEALETLKNAILKDAWLPKQKFFFTSNDTLNTPNFESIIAMQVAYALLKAATKTNDYAAIDTVKKYANAFCSNAQSLSFEQINRSKILQKKDSSIQTEIDFLNGKAWFFLLKSYSQLDKKESLWLNTSKNILDKIALNIKTNGEILIYKDVNMNKEFENRPSNGCWFVPAFALLYEINKESKYLTIAENAIQFYYNFYIKETILGAPNSKNAVLDEEINLAFIKSCYELHRLTRKMDYIKMAMDAFAYEFSWKFCYNSKHSNFPLRKLNFPTSGGNIRSKKYPYIHQMSNLIAYEMYYFYSITKDTYLYQRLKDTNKWGLSTFNKHDSEFGFGKKGWSSSQFYQSDALQNDTPWDGGILKKYHPLAASAVLLNVSEDIPDEFFE